MSDRDPGFALASVLILLALGMFAWNSAPLQSARPATNAAGWRDEVSDDQLPARLWQDPIGALQSYRQARQNGQSTRPPHSLRNDVESELAKNSELLVLVSMMSSDSHAETQEDRRHRRYAIVSALGDSSFVPRDAETLLVQGLRRVDVLANADGGYELEIPYEWYEFEPGTPGPFAPRSAVILWLDESWLREQPFEGMLRLVEEVAPADRVNRSKIKWVMLGPSRSSTLRTMVGERESRALDELSSSGLRGFYILSPTATVDDGEIDSFPHWFRNNGRTPFDSIDPSSPNQLLGAHFSRRPCVVPPSGRTCMRFLRTIRSDADLIASLAAELRGRGVEPEDTVVVLSEWDTFFGRSLPRELERALGPSQKIRRYTYARGIDGVTIGNSPTAQQVTTTAARGKIVDGGETTHRPFGDGQYDYLGRLAEIIREDDQQLRFDTGRGIKAIAVLGSDVYDKLLVLRALRNELAGAIWITTDLDANLLHPDEFPWTRNIVVASTYDLHLPVSGATSPPFRTSYQTSIYLATRVAVDDGLITEYWSQYDQRSGNEPFPGQRAFYDSVPPLLFEVGRGGFVSLGSSTGSDPATRSVSALPMTRKPETSVVHLLLGWFIVGSLGILAIHQVRPRSGRIVLALGAILVLLGGTLVFAVVTAPNGEPVSFTRGVSIWPTVLIRLSTVCLTLAFISSTLHRLQTNWVDIDHRFFGGEGVRPDEGLTLKEAMQRLFERLRLPLWAVGSLMLLVVLLGTMIVLRMAHAGAIARLVIHVAVFSGLVAVWWMFMYGRISSRVRIQSINRWAANDNDNEGSTTHRETIVSELWRDYGRYGEPQHRILRSAATTLIYFAVGSIIFTLLGGGSSPCRGKAACLVNGIVLAANVILMLFILFLVVDAIRLAVNWIQKLAHPDVRWSDQFRADLAKRLRLPESYAPYWLIIYVIGERTREISRLLYYPLVIVLLTLLSRSTYFDNWDYPLALIVVIGLYFAIAVGSAAKLNMTARTARETVLERLRMEGRRLQAESIEPVPEPTATEIDRLIKRIEDLKVGAYQPLWNQPLMRAAGLLLTGFALTYLEYARLFS